MSALIDRSSFLRHVGAYAASEACAKISRLGVVLVVARAMEPSAIGLAAAAMAAGEIIKSLTENGVGQRIIRASDTELDAVCRRAHSIAWIWCIGLAVLQVLVSVGFWSLGGNVLIGLMLALLAAEYLFVPGGTIQCALAMRKGQLTATAAVAGGQIAGANLVTIGLVLIWPHPIAIVVPKILSAPVWLVGMRLIHPWQKTVGDSAPTAPFIRFGSAILGVEVLKTVRLHGDKLIIGGLLGAEALGFWFFAVNAGLGLATSFAQAFSVALFPHLCAADDRYGALRNGLRTGLLLAVPVVLAQAALAPFYVPVVFGERWAGISDLVSMLCLCAIPALIWSATAQWLRATDRAGTELLVTAVLALLTLAAALLIAPHGLTALACTTLAIAAIVQVGGSIVLFSSAQTRTQEV